MSFNSEHVKAWRKRTKARLVEALGGKCVCCGYKRSVAAFDFHHRNPAEKELSFGKSRSCVVSWERLVKEARKCVLLCANCHREVHDGGLLIPTDAARFDEGFADYRVANVVEMEPCPVCSQPKARHLITCSRSCAAKKSRKVNWEGVDLVEMLKTKGVVRIANELGVSDMAVRKRLKKIRFRSSSMVEQPAVE